MHNGTVRAVLTLLFHAHCCKTDPVIQLILASLILLANVKVATGVGLPQPPVSIEDHHSQL